MRTTVTIDEDLAVRLQETAAARGQSFKQTLNEALRAGLAGSTARAKPYVMPVRDLGLRPGVELDKALALAGGLEDEEVVRKLDLRK